MNLLEKLMSIINKQKQAILFSQKDIEIIREISQCNNSYYKTKVLDVLQCELSDWSYDISKYMIKDKNRLIAEKSISVIQEFKRLEDFLNLFEQYQKDEFINYELIEAIGYIGIMRQLDDDIIEKRMKEILQNLEKKGYEKYRIYDYLFYITKNEKYLDAILNGLQSWDDDIRYQALYTVEDVILTEVAVRITPIKIDSMILFPYITDKTAPMISGINTPHNAMTNAGIPLFFNSSISVSRPA